MKASRLSILTLLWMYIMGSSSERRSGLRWDVLESDGRLVRSLTNGKKIVTLEYNDRGELVQCWQTKEGRTSDAVALMFYAAMADSNAVSKDAIDIDMTQIVTDCQSYMKQIYAGNSTELQNEIDIITGLREGFDGSKWCGLNPRRSKSKALKREDRCCKKWHECSLHIKAYSYDHTLYNYRPYSLPGCNCTVNLEACLRNVTASSLAEEVLEIQFTEGRGQYMKCLTAERRETHCVTWDQFYHKCTKYDWANYAHITSLYEYKNRAIKADQQQGTTEESPTKRPKTVTIEKATPTKLEL